MAPAKRGPQLVSAQIMPKKTGKAAPAASSTGESSAIVSKTRKPPKSDVELKRNALVSNPRGVKIYNANLENSKAVMAGYLLLADTNALAALLAQEDNSNLLNAFFESRKRGFGIVNRNETSSWSCKAIFECIEGASATERALFDCTTIPIKHEQLPGTTVKSTSPGYLTWINVMHRLILQNEHCFQNDEILSPYIGPHTAEDWYRAYSLIRYHHRMVTQAVKASKSSARGPMNLAAETPKFLVAADYRASAMTENDGSVTAVNADDSSSGGEEEGEDDDLVENMDAELQEAIEKSYEEGALMLSGGGDLNVATKECGRPALTRAQVGRFLESEGKKARVLHDIGKDPSDTVSQMVFHAAEAAGSLSAIEIDEQQNNVYNHERQEFWKLMGEVSAVSVKTPSYLDCCKALDIDPKTRSFGDNRSYQPWQVIGIQKMLLMEQSLLHGGINACDCGTGKTVTCLGLIEHSAKLQAKAVETGLLTDHVFKPTLVACPSQLIDVWYDDHLQFFSGPDRLILKQFYGSEGIITNPVRKATLLGTKLDHLTHYLDSLDPSDPSTARVVILTAYSTWHRRTLMAEEAADENTKGKGKAVVETEEDYDPDDEDEAVAANPKMVYTSSLRHCFDRVVCDEAHSVKNGGTLTHLAIKHLEAEKIWFVSATPMINHVRDLAGYLSLLWKEEWTLGEELGLEQFYQGDIDTGALVDEEDESKVDVITAVNRGENVFQLSPYKYRIVTSGDNPDSGLIGLALRAILSQIQIRHTMATVIDMGDGQMLRIGENIPHYRITTVELAMSKAQNRRYQQVYNEHVGSLYTVAAEGGNGDASLGPEKPQGRLNMVSHRRLVHATLNTHLETLVCSVGKRSLVKDINRWYDKANDFGVTHLFRHTRPAPYFRPYQDRLSMAEYMSGPSVKIQYLCRLLHKICIVEEKRVQIVVDMPMNQWHLESFLVNLGLNVLSLRSAHSHADRRETIRVFNDPSVAVDVLVTNFRTSSLGVNLQGCCSKTIIMDTAANVNTIIQTIGRIHRLGQKEVQDIYIVTVDHSYDQILQARAANKMVSQLAGESRIQGDSKEEMEEAAEQLVTKILGQRCSRVAWLDLDLKAKDKLKQTRPCTQEQKLKEREDKGKRRNDGNASGHTRGAEAAMEQEVLSGECEAGPSSAMQTAAESDIQAWTPVNKALDQESGDASDPPSIQGGKGAASVGEVERGDQVVSESAMQSSSSNALDASNAPRAGDDTSSAAAPAANMSSGGGQAGKGGRAKKRPAPAAGAAIPPTSKRPRRGKGASS